MAISALAVPVGALTAARDWTPTMTVRGSLTERLDAAQAGRGRVIQGGASPKPLGKNILSP